MRRDVLLPALLVCCVFGSSAKGLVAAQVGGGADEERSERHYLEGIRFFQRALRAPSDAQQRTYFEEALTHFQEATRESPRYELAVYYLGITYGKLGRYDDAIPALEEAVHRYEGAPVRRDGLVSAYKDLGAAFYQTQRYTEAIRTLDKALEEDDQEGFAHFYKGLSHFQIAEFDSALKHLERALELQPSLQARVAYHIGLAYLAQDRSEEAVQSLEKAASGSQSSDLATDAGRLVQQLGGAPRPQISEERPWQLRLALGAQYDSNVILQPEEGPVFGQITDEDDYRASVALGGSIQVWDTSRSYLRANYDFHYTRHGELEDFNLEAHLPRAEAGLRLGDDMTLSVEGGFNFYRLGGEDYLRELYIQPAFGFFTGSSGYGTVFYKFSDRDFRVIYFDPERDGDIHEFGGRYYVLLQGFRRHLYLGYRHVRDHPDSAAGSDYRYTGNQVEAGIRLPISETGYIEGGYAFRNEDYEFPISFDPGGRLRDDDSHDISVLFDQPLSDYFTLRLEYLARLNNSSLEIFEYRRHIGSVVFQFTF